MNKLLLLGSVVSPCPPGKQGGTERVAYYQAKHLARQGIEIIFVGAVRTRENFQNELDFEGELEKETILSNIEFVEIGGGTQYGNAVDAIKIDPKFIEASRKLRLEMVNLARVQELMIKRQREYKLILNNMRGEAVFLPLAQMLKKTVVNVMHLSLFPELASIFKQYNTALITISQSQRQEFVDLNYLANIYNPVNTKIFSFNPTPKNYALMMSTIGFHKNQKDAIIACKKAGLSLILAGKIRDQDYFEAEIAPLVDGKAVIYHGELDFEAKLDLYQNARVFLFPILWQEPFGLVVIESLACGTPVIAYPHGGPSEIIRDGKNGYLVSSASEMAHKIGQIDKIDRLQCRQDAQARFDEAVIGLDYYRTISSIMNE